MFFDLNIASGDSNVLIPLLEQEAKLGYSAIALNLTVAGRIQSEHTCKLTPVSSPTGFVTQAGAPMRQLTRLTVRMEDPMHLHSLTTSNPVFKSYDIVAIQPMSDKVWEKCSKDLDVDIITFDLAQRIPIQLKIPKVREAIQRGLYFEITYSAALTDAHQRRTALGNALNLVRLTGGRNIIISSGARKAMDIRGPYDVANLGMLFGVKQDAALAAVSANCASVIAHGQTRKSVMGIFTIIPRSALPPADEWKVDMTKRSEPPAATQQALALVGGAEKKKKKKKKEKQQGQKAPNEAEPPVMKGISASLSRTAPTAATTVKAPAASAEAQRGGRVAKHKRKSSKGGETSASEQPLKRATGSEKDTDSDMGSAVTALRLQEGRK